MPLRVVTKQSRQPVLRSATYDVTGRSTFDDLIVRATVEREDGVHDVLID
jgi:hypothetical protein